MAHLPLPSMSLPSLPRLSLAPLNSSSPPLSRVTSATISESSTGVSDMSTGRANTSVTAPVFQPYRTELPPCAIPEPCYTSSGDLYCLPDTGFVPIRPRTNAAGSIYKKRCETCLTTHDGSFGAGRFCSSRCARTVGGLAHRKKRMLERESKQKAVRENGLRAKKLRRSYSSLEDIASHDTAPVVTVTKLSSPPTTINFDRTSPKSIMRISALLNPES